MSRQRKLYLSELLLRLEECDIDIKITYSKLKIEWIYTNKIQAINDLINRPFWNNEVKKYRIKNKVLTIVITGA